MMPSRVVKFWYCSSPLLERHEPRTMIDRVAASGARERVGTLVMQANGLRYPRTIRKVWQQVLIMCRKLEIP
jgi:hypothetical protein